MSNWIKLHDGIRINTDFIRSYYEGDKRVVMTFSEYTEDFYLIEFESQDEASLAIYCIDHFMGWLPSQSNDLYIKASGILDLDEAMDTCRNQFMAELSKKRVALNQSADAPQAE